MVVKGSGISSRWPAHFRGSLLNALVELVHLRVTPSETGPAGKGICLSFHEFYFLPSHHTTQESTDPDFDVCRVVARQKIELMK